MCRIRSFTIDAMMRRKQDWPSESRTKGPLAEFVVSCEKANLSSTIFLKLYIGMPSSLSSSKHLFTSLSCSLQKVRNETYFPATALFHCGQLRIKNLFGFAKSRWCPKVWCPFWISSGLIQALKNEKLSANIVYKNIMVI